MRLGIAIVGSLLLACASQPVPATTTVPATTVPGASRVSEAGSAHATGSPSHADEEALRAVRGVHGGAGPWVVSGYRMGSYALRVLGLTRGSFDLEVVHHSPREVQYSCIADGAAAATGASLGRLNLSLEPATASQTRTTYRNRRSGASVTLQPTAEFTRRYMDVPRAQLSAAGEEVLHLPDDEIFEEVR